MRKKVTEKQKLTPKQKAFADYFIESGNMTDAAKKAGYSEKTAYKMGAENLKKPHIAAYIAERILPTEEKRIASADEVMEFLTAVMRGEVKDAFGLDPTLADRTNAAREMMKRHNVIGDNNKDALEKLDQVLDQIGGVV